ncbi:carboxypeptidase-like regulatory domain-containing protein [Pyxidicoccus sp. MSG2]|uniref:carboxypeptidase-like regulatory domain-containing protein n=1 Tax=Pyxidicoccus sp. MSG2 TaxID=2996790 RepID=UPI00226EC27B|nr:carboxypeptidase-like regulatory domain-containing protein [Pyxidicoccus sp. MSG2]MCY1019599.1 carboxypeptidase-like regulatory domain-containing protein [Pyxidicoccus sp. MSG2]
MHARRWMSALVVLGALALLSMWCLQRCGTPGVGAPRREAPSTERAAAPRVPAASSPARPQTGPRIQGIVVDTLGRPVAGVRVSASEPEPGQTLSELPCPEEARLARRYPGSAPVTLDVCLGEGIPLAMQQALELLAAREGEAPVYAEATTAADGSFVLEALPEGPLSLWALGEQGAAVRSGIPAGSEGVELVLEQGRLVKGTVRGEGVPLAGAAVTVLDLDHSRFFDTTTGPDGDFRVGPLPYRPHRFFVSKEGWLPSLGRDETVTLHRPRQLTGRVVAGGAPVADIEVRVGPGADVPRGGARKTLTDARGHFTFVVPAGLPHTLSASSSQQSAVARVEPGASPAEVLLELGSALQVEGTVWDDARSPVSGARVVLIELEHMNTELETVTDAAGRYSLGPVEPGPWGFVVTAPRHIDLDLPDVKEHTHTLAPGMRPVDFTLRRAPSVTGHVTDAEGRPLAGIALDLQPAGERRRFWTEDSALTDEEGRFILDAEAPGDLYIKASDDRVRTEFFPVRAPSEGVHLTLHPGASLTGTVVDARGLPLGHGRVKLVGWAETNEQESFSSAAIDPRGGFQFQGLWPGRYRVLASQQTDGIERRAWCPVEAIEGVEVRVELRLEPERDLSGLVVDGAGQPLAGVFVRARPPQEGAPPGRWRGDTDALHGPPIGIETGPDGRFLLRYLTEAEYDVSAVKPGYTFAPARSTGGTEGEKGMLRVGAGTAEARLVMARQSFIVGRVVGPDGQPLPRVQVASLVVEGPDGAFSVPFEKPSPQWLSFHASGMASHMRLVEPRADGQDVDLGVVRLGPGIAVRGRVVDARTSAPVKGANIAIVNRLPSPTGVGVTVYSGNNSAADGSFQVAQVDPESNVLSIEAPGYQHQRVEVDATSGPLTVRLEPEPEEPEPGEPEPE